MSRFGITALVLPVADTKIDIMNNLESVTIKDFNPFQHQKFEFKKLEKMQVNLSKKIDGNTYCIGIIDEELNKKALTARSTHLEPLPMGSIVIRFFKNYSQLEKEHQVIFLCLVVKKIDALMDYDNVVGFEYTLAPYQSSKLSEELINEVSSSSSLQDIVGFGADKGQKQQKSIFDFILK
jgi:hypothetical protein